MEKKWRKGRSKLVINQFYYEAINWTGKLTVGKRFGQPVKLGKMLTHVHWRHCSRLGIWISVKNASKLPSSANIFLSWYFWAPNVSGNVLSARSRSYKNDWKGTGLGHLVLPCEASAMDTASQIKKAILRQGMSLVQNPSGNRWVNSS